MQIGDGKKGGYTALDPAGSYRVATINFMLAGGDGYTVLAQGTNKLAPACRCGCDNRVCRRPVAG